MKKQDLNIGDLVIFQIGERLGFSASNKDAWGALKILDLGDPRDNSLSVAVRSGLWKNKPGLQEISEAEVLVAKRFRKLGNSQTEKPVIFATPFDCDFNLLNAEVIGWETKFNQAELRAKTQIEKDGHCGSISNIRSAAMHLDHEHRAEFDEENWKAEIAAYSARQQQKREQKALREKQRLKTLTLEVLTSETLFEAWENRTQIVPPEFTAGVQTRSQDLVHELSALGEKPKRNDVRTHLKKYIEWINSYDGSFGYQIETEEREDLMGFVEEVCWATRQKPLIEEADAWRDW